MVDSLVIKKLASAFPNSFINTSLEFIAHKEANEYFLLEDCESEFDVKCKVLEWLSRGAFKTCPFNGNLKNKRFHNFMLNGINKFLGTDFTEGDISIIYQKLGNRVNHNLTVEFVNSGYDLRILEKGEATMKELTRERAIQLHRRLWRWIALKTLKEKRIVSKNEFPMFRDNIRHACCFCYCCEYAEQKREEAISDSPTDSPAKCVYCPINWGIDVNRETGGIFYVHCTESIYDYWEDEEEYREAAKLAFKIAALSERQDNKEAHND